MRRFYTLIGTLWALSFALKAQDLAPLDKSNRDVLLDMAQRSERQAREKRTKAEEIALRRGIPLAFVDSISGRVVQLVDMKPWGEPLYYETHNRIAGITVSTNRVQAGGSNGLSLTGSGLTLHM